MTNASGGIFVSIEGGDGAGKSTICECLHRALQARGHTSCKIDKQPEFDIPFLSDHVTKLGALTWAGARADERNRICDEHWLYLAAAWYAVIDQHCLAPALARHDFVLADSWYHKLLARFALKAPPIRRLSTTLFRRLTAPDRIFFLDVSPQLAADRKSSYGYAECGNFDGHTGCTRETFIAYQARVRRSYRRMITKPRWTAIAANDLAENAIVTVMLDTLKDTI